MQFYELECNSMQFFNSLSSSQELHSVCFFLQEKISLNLFHNIMVSTLWLFVIGQSLKLRLCSLCCWFPLNFEFEFLIKLTESGSNNNRYCYCWFEHICSLCPHLLLTTTAMLLLLLLLLLAIITLWSAPELRETWPTKQNLHIASDLSSVKARLNRLDMTE